LIASQQVPQLLRIADLSSMTVWVQVSEADITRLRTGMDVYFTTLGYGDRRWKARLSRLLPAPPKSPGTVAVPGVASNVVLYTALFDVDNAAGELRAEMSAQVHFIVAQAKAAVLVPAAALSDSDKTKHDNTVTVVQADGSTQARAVRLGIRDRFDVQIVTGLSAGEKLVFPARSAAGKAELP
jgi:macrolide-specific efflux system membrane fusion protein